MIDIQNHFWAIGGSTTEVYSSNSNTMVPVDDASYVSWLVFNQRPTPITDEQELAGVLHANGSQLPAWLLATEPTFIQPTPDTYSKDQLASYAAEARRQKMQGDIVVNGLPFSTDPLTYGSLNSAFIFTQAKTGDTFSWKLPDGSFITLNKADIEALHNASNTFAQDCFKCEDETLTAIEGGTITDLAGVDAAFAAIPNSFTGVAGADARKVRHKRAG